MTPDCLDLYCGAGLVHDGLTAAGLRPLGIDLERRALRFITGGDRRRVRSPPAPLTINPRTRAMSQIPDNAARPLGQIVRARDVPELAGKYGSHLCIWAACEICGKRRWVLVKGTTPQSRVCYGCRGVFMAGPRPHLRGAANPNYKPGAQLMKCGYLRVRIEDDDPLISMAGKDRRAYEHRYVMAKSLGRPLMPNEEVHHRDGNKLNNSLENLELLEKGEHTRRHWQQGHRVAALEEMVRKLGGQP